VLTVLVVLGLFLPLVLPIFTAAAAASPGQAATSPGQAAASPGQASDDGASRSRAGDVGAASEGPVASDAVTADEEKPLVVVGTAGLRWEDLSALATPNLWELSVAGAAGNLVVRSVRSTTCPADGWLALSAGRRAADVPMEEYGACRRLESVSEDGAVPAWATYVDAAEGAAYDATPGLLGDLLVSSGTSSVAVGPGAAVALATSDGTVAGDHAFAYASPTRLAGQVAGALPGHALAVVDVGAVRDRNRPLVGVDTVSQEPMPEPKPSETPSPSTGEAWLLRSPARSQQVAAIDQRIGAVLDSVRDVAPDATVIVASLADSGTRSLLQLAVADGPALGELPADGALLDSRSTRQPGMIQSTDLTPTMLAMLGIDGPASLVGAPLDVAPDGRTGPARISYLTDVGDHAVAVRALKGPFHSALVLINLLLYAAVTVGLNRKNLDRAADWLDRRPSPTAHRAATALGSRRPARALSAIRAVAVAVGAIPIASYLANLLPWWRAGSPGAVLLSATALIAALIAAVAVRGPWRRNLLGPVAVVAGLTAVVLAVDVATGATLQISSLMGVEPQVGGRFYGFNNSSFSLFAASTILAATCVADPLVRAGRRRLAAVAVGAIGLVAVVLDGAPTIGADFGGPPALIPGFLVLALLAAGVRLTWRRVLLVLGITGVLALSFSVIDWLRPPAERSHLGRFVETVLDGGLWSVVGRKIAQNLANLFGSTLTFLAIGGIVVVVVLLTRPLRNAAHRGRNDSYGWLVGGGSVARIDGDIPMLRPAVVSLAVTFTIAFLANDSGIVLPAIGISLAVPLLVSVLAGWLLARGEPAQASLPPSSVRLAGASDVVDASGAGASDQAR
jgi:hypothetical protein